MRLSASAAGDANLCGEPWPLPLGSWPLDYSTPLLNSQQHHWAIGVFQGEVPKSSSPPLISQTVIGLQKSEFRFVCFAWKMISSMTTRIFRTVTLSVWSLAPASQFSQSWILICWWKNRKLLLLTPDVVLLSSCFNTTALVNPIKVFTLVWQRISFHLLIYGTLWMCAFCLYVCGLSVQVLYFLYHGSCQRLQKHSAGFLTLKHWSYVPKTHQSRKRIGWIPKITQKMDKNGTIQLLSTNKSSLELQPKSIFQSRVLGPPISSAKS